VNAFVSELDGTATAVLPVEIVERKGLGHPDTICDALAEEVSLALSRFYLRRFGYVLHHNVDKVLLRGGSAQAAFAGGAMKEPIELYLAGRATFEYRGVAIPVEDIALDACNSWLTGNLHALDVAEHVRLHCLIRPGSTDLVELFERQRRTGAPILANDTSIGAGYAPLTPLETAVIAAERSLQEPRVPERGEDVKVMGVRVGEQARLMNACAFVGRYLQDMDCYLAARSDAAERVRAAIEGIVGRVVDVDVNAADDPEAGSVYLTVTGTSAEAGDDGQTGRGNRANGLIAPARPMTMESLAGKNPITHTGKLYSVAATQIAEALVLHIEDVREAHVLLVSKIGTRIDTPDVAHLRLRTDHSGQVATLAPRAREIARQYFDRIGSLWERLLARNIATDGIAGL
jgi:S-adenosylmethionine synthetase